MLDLLQAAATFNAQAFGTTIVITDKSSETYNPATNTATPRDTQITVQGIWHEGIDKAISKNPDGGVSIVRGSYRAIQIPALDQNNAAFSFLPQRGDWVQRTISGITQTWIVEETLSFHHGDGSAFHMIYLQGA
jgi:hypothetical protein